MVGELALAVQIYTWSKRRGWFMLVSNTKTTSVATDTGLCHIYTQKTIYSLQTFFFLITLVFSLKNKCQSGFFGKNRF